MNELTDEELLYASEEDWAFYNKCIEGLPTREGKNGDYLDKFGIEIPYHSGPHILKHFRDTLSIVKPEKIFEIGFNMGHSSSMWLNLFGGDIVSCDVSRKEETIKGYEYLQSRYCNRFNFEWRDSLDGDWAISMGNLYFFDLAFIDGAHDEKSIIQDTEMCINMKIPYILYDDFYSRYGETQKALVHFPELELVKDMNNLRLYKVNYDN
jgi:hypothetical protein